MGLHPKRCELWLSGVELKKEEIKLNSSLKQKNSSECIVGTLWNHKSKEGELIRWKTYHTLWSIDGNCPSVSRNLCELLWGKGFFISEKKFIWKGIKWMERITGEVTIHSYFQVTLKSKNYSIIILISARHADDESAWILIVYCLWNYFKEWNNIFCQSQFHWRILKCLFFKNQKVLLRFYSIGGLKILPKERLLRNPRSYLASPFAHPLSVSWVRKGVSEIAKGRRSVCNFSWWIIATFFSSFFSSNTILCLQIAPISYGNFSLN